ncbi:MAG: hypothetical protein HZY79_12055 [Rhodoblastus sp.]|nr:MAG: hypothetical protein HZY79_12055 [Rhodoblastus sp.]
MKARTKICGITTIEDALAAVAAGADALGFVFADGPRRISPGEARAIVEALPPFTTTVGVFVDEPLDSALSAAAESGVSMVQLQGEESRDYCKAFKQPVIKGFRVDGAIDADVVNSYDVSAYLFDARVRGVGGGSGRRFDWTLLRGLELARPIIVAGGLNEGNVHQAIDLLHPYGVDVGSGVASSPTRKDSGKMRDFVAAVARACDGRPRLPCAQERDILRDAFHERPLVEINDKQFLINSLTEQVPATSATLLHVAARRVCDAMSIDPDMKLVGEEDKGGVLLAAVSLLSGLPFGIARWYPSGLSGQIEVRFDCEYTSGGLYLNGVEPGDRVVIVDDLISTGGTLIGLIEAVRKAGAQVEQVVCVAEKVNYGGVQRVRDATGLDVRTLVRVDIAGSVSKVVDVAYM